MEGEIGKMEPWGDQTNVKPMFRVSFSKTDKSFTLIQEGITLTEEQAMNIAHAYNMEYELKIKEHKAALKADCVLKGIPYVEYPPTF